jgi:hypothetical protein
MAARGDGKQGKGEARKGEIADSAAGAEIPKKSTIVAEKTFVSPKGRRYAILETDQSDPYDEPDPKAKKGPK